MKRKTSSRSKADKKLQCKYCDEIVEVSHEATKVTCWRCTMKMVNGTLVKAE